MKVRIAFGWQTTRPDGSVARVVRFLEHRPVRKTYEGGDRGDLRPRGGSASGGDVRRAGGA